MMNGMSKFIVTKFMQTPKHQKGDCVIWDGPQWGKGYGKVAAKCEIMYAHRVAYALSHGSQPKNNVLHSCDTPLCVNPKHLSDGTQKDNARDMYVRGRSGTTVLNEKEVLEIRASKDSRYSLADQYSVSYHTIRSIKIGKSWTHL